MTTTISYLKRITHKSNHLYLHYAVVDSDGNPTTTIKKTSGFDLTEGILLSIYKTNSILKAEIEESDGNNFGNYGVSSQILFESANSDYDFKGGFMKIVPAENISNKIRLIGETSIIQATIPVGATDRFHLSIIGVDDIRASIGDPPNYTETYLMEEQKIFLRIAPKELPEGGTKKYLEIRYAKR